MKAKLISLDDENRELAERELARLQEENERLRGTIDMLLSKLEKQ